MYVCHLETRNLSQNSFHSSLNSDIGFLGNSTSTPSLENSTLVGTPGNMQLGGGIPPHATTSQTDHPNAQPGPGAIGGIPSHNTGSASENELVLLLQQVP